MASLELCNGSTQSTVVIKGLFAAKHHAGEPGHGFINDNKFLS
jgi:hypothetical protein